MIHSKSAGGRPLRRLRELCDDVLHPDLKVRIRINCNPIDDLARTTRFSLDKVFPECRVDGVGAVKILERLMKQGPLTASSLLSDVPPELLSTHQTTLMWLAKVGIIEWEE